MDQSSSISRKWGFSVLAPISQFRSEMRAFLPRDAPDFWCLALKLPYSTPITLSVALSEPDRPQYTPVRYCNTRVLRYYGHYVQRTSDCRPTIWSLAAVEDRGSGFAPDASRTRTIYWQHCTPSAITTVTARCKLAPHCSAV